MPHLQVDIAYPLEYPLVGPDHRVCVLRFTAGSALLEDLGDGGQGVSRGDAGHMEGAECWTHSCLDHTICVVRNKRSRLLGCRGPGV